MAQATDGRDPDGGLPLLSHHWGRVGILPTQYEPVMGSFPVGRGLSNRYIGPVEDHAQPLEANRRMTQTQIARVMLKKKRTKHLITGSLKLFPWFSNEKNECSQQTLSEAERACQGQIRVSRKTSTARHLPR